MHSTKERHKERYKQRKRQDFVTLDKKSQVTTW